MCLKAPSHGVKPVCSSCRIIAEGHSTIIPFIPGTQVLLIGQDTLRDFTTGHIFDLVSNDVQRMELAPKMCVRFWMSLVDLVVTACLIWHFVEWQALVGLAFLVLLVPFTASLSHIGGKLRRKTAAVTDRRVLLMNEVVSAIRTVKTNAWEWIYRDKIREIRR